MNLNDDNVVLTQTQTRVDIYKLNIVQNKKLLPFLKSLSFR